MKPTVPTGQILVIMYFKKKPLKVVVVLISRHQDTYRHNSHTVFLYYTLNLEHFNIMM